MSVYIVNKGMGRSRGRNHVGSYKTFIELLKRLLEIQGVAVKVGGITPTRNRTVKQYTTIIFVSSRMALEARRLAGQHPELTVVLFTANHRITPIPGVHVEEKMFANSSEQLQRVGRLLSNN